MTRGPWDRIKPPEYHTASDFDKMKWACGIPSRFWSVKLNQIRPAAATYELGDHIERISAAVQTKYLKERVTNPTLLDSNRLVCFASSPTDEHALAAACLLASAYIEAIIAQKFGDELDDISKPAKSKANGKASKLPGSKKVKKKSRRKTSSKSRSTSASA